jgi:D-alanine transaminase
LNGSYLPESDAKVSIFDRGFLMADAVYEVTGVRHGRLMEYDGHMKRLRRSLDALGMDDPLSAAEWLEIHRKLVAANDLLHGLIYLQISRGDTGDRDFFYPSKDTRPTIVLFTQAKPPAEDNIQAKTGIRVITVPDLRWSRRDLKTVQLLYPCMAKQDAKQQGADDAWFVEDGFVTEGTSNNAFIIKDKKIITRPLSEDILHGITRASLLRFCAEVGLEVEERPFTVAQAKAADEAFFSASSACVIPVVAIDDVNVGRGNPGPLTRRLREIYLDEASKSSI